MSILKALEKKRTEDPHGISNRPAENIVQFDRGVRQAHLPVELLSRDLSIGNPSSAFIPEE